MDTLMVLRKPLRRRSQDAINLPTQQRHTDKKRNNVSTEHLPILLEISPNVEEEIQSLKSRKSRVVSPTTHTKDTEKQQISFVKLYKDCVNYAMDIDRNDDLYDASTTKHCNSPNLSVDSVFEQYGKIIKQHVVYPLASHRKPTVKLLFELDYADNIQNKVYNC